MDIAYERVTSNAAAASGQLGAGHTAYPAGALDPFDTYHGVGIPNVFLRGVAS